MGMPLHGIWCSDLLRCTETAGIIAREAGLPVRADPAFREICLGSWEGRSRQEVQAMFPGGYDERGRDIWRIPPEGGESFSMLADRVLPALDSLAATLPHDALFLLVTHCGVARVILRRFLALPESEILSIPFPYGAFAWIDAGSSGLS